MEKEASEIEEFIASLEDYQPTVPDEVTSYYLNRTGFVCTDIKMKRLIALAAQKFISDIATDALQYCKIRQQSASRDKSKARKLVLTLEDLSQSLKEYGINLKKPEYFADKLSAGVEVAQQQARERDRERAERREKGKASRKEKVKKKKKNKEG
eukprot:Phypoly_transcript_22529.p1 GENE.Phypoly_transcript_22529~~Phypoly_transcript_22529.p1  ORF type:complete len:154 (+),score=27.33 Phypoly_transcript_22529:117-578(+)